ncbi:tRNA (adenosine(37)-N6)-dimethylallyltransferase MiaA [Salinicoccus sp. HZC-1]|uniref:tRNA (adenosine(37)-N6)-dimethylallyltransferase MiaA n=1 Tax=Salinicoccus sp. HZC-1 TaxID=3385497 RepID=UPI00398BA70E
MSNLKKLLILVGPTAIGKTALSIEIAKKFNLEIISGDSMQVYRGMDIGTGKITEEEKEGIRHHMIDVIEPEASFSVQEFQKHVTETIDEIHEDDRIPFIVGGTGHYIRALIHGYEFDEEDDKEKQELTETLEHLGTRILYDRLKKIDPKAAGEIHPNNRQRVIRMLVKFELSDRISNRIGPGYTDDVKYDTFIVGLTRERKNIHANIERRVDTMFENGLEDEARNLFENHSPSKTASAAIGYKEFLPYFEGSASLENVKEQIKQNTRQYAKRQLTFFRNQLPVEWYDLDKVQTDIILEDIYQFLHAKERENHGK